MRHRVSREPRVHIALHTNTRAHETHATPGVACVLTLQRTASHCNTLQRALQCVQCAHSILVGVACVLTLQRTASHYNTLQRVLQCIQCAHNILEGVACVLTLQHTVFSVHTTF